MRRGGDHGRERLEHGVRRDPGPDQELRDDLAQPQPQRGGGDPVVVPVAFWPTASGISAAPHSIDHPHRDPDRAVAAAGPAAARSPAE